jgi:hypothetical protein
MMIRVVRLCCLILLGVTCSAFAEDRALVIAIGDYRYECPPSTPDCRDPDLPGIDHDLVQIKETLRLLGFSEHQVLVLADQDASLTGVRVAIDQWLVRGVDKDDRVLLYFSGHGSQIPDTSDDEQDRLDEVLLTWDMEIDGDTLRNVLIDDELGELLERVPAKRSLVLIDACHSGTATKAWDPVEHHLAKNYRWSAETESPPDSGNDYATRGIGVAAVRHFISLAASRDDEVAWATPNGSLFTNGIAEAVRVEAAGDRRLTVAELARECEAFIAAGTTRPHHPTIGGNQSLRDMDLFERSWRGLWEEMATFVDSAGGKLTLRSLKPLYRAGDELELEVETGAGQGHLYLIHVSHGSSQALMLFPNPYQSNNLVEAGQTVRVPPLVQVGSVLQASLPPGVDHREELLVAVLTPRPLQLGDPSLVTKTFVSLGTDEIRNAVGKVVHRSALQALQDPGKGTSITYRAGMCTFEIIRPEGSPE